MGSSESKASLITGISLYMQFYILLGETVFYVFTAEVAKWVLEEDVKNSEELKNDRISYTFDRAGWNDAFRRTSITTWNDAGFIQVGPGYHDLLQVLQTWKQRKEILSIQIGDLKIILSCSEPFV